MKAFLRQNHEAIANLAAATQNLMLCLAILLGGGWTWFMLDALRQRELASAELQKAQQDLLQQEVVAVELDAEAIADPVSGGRLLSVVASLRNGGSKNATIALSADAVRVARVSFGADGPEYEQAGSSPVVGLVSSTGQPVRQEYTILRAGETKSIPFLVSLAQPGVYFVQFSGQLEKAGERSSISKGVSVWKGAKFVRVE